MIRSFQTETESPKETILLIPFHENNKMMNSMDVKNVKYKKAQ